MRVLAVSSSLSRWGALCFLLSVVFCLSVSANELISSFSRQESACAPGTLRWVFNTTAQNVGDPSLVVDGAVFFAADDSFYALDTTSGQPLWKLKYPGQSVREKMPATCWGRVFVVVGDNQFITVDTKTGGTDWTFEAESGSNGWTSNPQVDETNGMVFTNSPDNLFGIDCSMGKMIWLAPLNNSLRDTSTTMLVYNSTIYIASNDRFHAFTTLHGTELWSVPLPDDVHGTTSGAFCEKDGLQLVIFLVLGQYGNSLIALDTQKNGQFVWNFTDPDSNATNWDNYANHNPAVDGVVYVKGVARQFALDCATGVPLWSFPAPAADGGLSSSFVSNGTLYVGSDDYRVYALNATNGSELWSAQTGSYIWSDPVTDGNGALFVGSEDGGFYSFCT